MWHLYPTHGAGSFCAAPTSGERISTIGQEKLWNPLVQPLDEESFVVRSLSGLPSYPTYFKYLRGINQRGPALLGGVPVLKPLNSGEVRQLSSQGVAILDTRPARSFAAGHIPGFLRHPAGRAVDHLGWLGHSLWKPADPGQQ